MVGKIDRTCRYGSRTWKIVKSRFILVRIFIKENFIGLSLRFKDTAEFSFKNIAVLFIRGSSVIGLSLLVARPAGCPAACDRSSEFLGIREL
jgi:hypothetical protein